LDRTTANVGDTLTLNIDTDGPDQGAQPNLTPLQQDFDIVSTGSSTQMQIINGRQSQRSSWIVSLEPKHLGDITIPALQVGNSTTQPLTLTVNDEPPASSDDGTGKIFIEAQTSATEQEPYVQQQIQYTVRLYYNAPILQGELTDPTPRDAMVERLGEDRHYQTTRNGRQYQVVERHYAIFPEKSGRLTIPPVSFKGEVAGIDTDNSPFSRMDALMKEFTNDSFFNDALLRSRIMNRNFFSAGGFGSAGKRISAHSESITLDVKAQPSSFHGSDWLPSEQLNLRDDWNDNPPHFRVGEPVTRTITIEAKGLAASHLPQLDIEAPAQMRVYPEKPGISNDTDNGGMYGRSTQSVAYVASQPGQYTVPEVRLPWWDITHNEERVAVLPSREIRVLPGVQTAQASAAQTSIATATTTPATADQPTIAPDSKPDTKRFPTRHPWIIAGTLGLLSLGVLMSAIFSALRKRSVLTTVFSTNPNSQSRTQTTSPSVVVEARRALQQACDTNNPKAAAVALLLWAGVEWPNHPPRNLGVLAARVPHIAPLIHELDKTLYAPLAAPWNGSTLWQALKGGWNNPTAPANTASYSDVMPLYPPR
jgi:hypothetical protein